MKKIIAFLGTGAVMIALCAGIVACRDDNTKEKEPEGVSLKEALAGNGPEQFVSKESLPQWLVDKIEQWELRAGDPFLYIIVLRGRWNGHTIYRIYNRLSSCLTCDYYYENGENIRDTLGYEVFSNVLRVCLKISFIKI